MKVVLFSAITFFLKYQIILSNPDTKSIKTFLTENMQNSTPLGGLGSTKNSLKNSFFKEGHLTTGLGRFLLSNQLKNNPQLRSRINKLNMGLGNSSDLVSKKTAKPLK
ncbi:hypothetical protein CWI36_0362p0010 [Hamiltosporidium magnivora]|uniref:Uncharacterized protein n=1 Tax=Hamiltosporidium magnivora TaxID=148818 RepID=A0A4Q9LHF0_9MICR|nr:hypothetical protein CWI36_0362p0010 [Hamiltosporidium magnivora]